MATIHTGTTLVPSKLELLDEWLPRQPWFRGAGTSPQLSRAGGFRLDDPEGEVGIEFMVVTDGATDTAYAVPMTYRAAPLEGADAALIGTTEHGVLGTRWVYDAEHDPVATTQLLEFVAGRVEAQHQSRSDTVDPSVGRPTAVVDVTSLELVRVLGAGEAGGVGSVEVDWTRPDGSVARGTVAVVR
jgi:Maltokinase N-terminal cap domain